MDENKKANITIGIGVTTTPNREHLYDQWMEQLHKHTHRPYHLHVHCDEQYKGVAYSKNQNLRALKDCDYVFLFDDDCWPIHDDWIEWFVGSRQSHLLHLDSVHNKTTVEINLYQENELKYTVERYRDCGGVFMMITKEIVNKVGYMNPAYGQYGFEHAGYSNRIHRAGFTETPYEQLKDTKYKIFSKDYVESNVKSSIPSYKKQKLIEQNREIFIKEINSEQIYYPYENTI